MSDQLLWSIEETAMQLGNIPTRRVWKLIKNKEIQAIKIGRTTVVPATEARAWVAKQMVGVDNQQGAGPGLYEGESSCPTDATTRPPGGQVTPITAARELGALLAQPTGKKPKR